MVEGFPENQRVIRETLHDDFCGGYNLVAQTDLESSTQQVLEGSGNGSGIDDNTTLQSLAACFMSSSSFSSSTTTWRKSMHSSSFSGQGASSPYRFFKYSKCERNDSL